MCGEDGKRERWSDGDGKGWRECKKDRVGREMMKGCRKVAKEDGRWGGGGQKVDGMFEARA